MTKANEVKAAKTPQPEEPDAPLLSISSLSKPTAYIDIDKKKYPFVNLDAIGLRERQAIADLLTETFDLGGMSIEKKLTKKQEATYDEKLRKLCFLILPTITRKTVGTLKEQDGLGTGHLADIAVAFFVASGESVPDKLELTKRMEKLTRSLPNPTGAKSSRALRRSTQNRRRGG